MATSDKFVGVDVSRDTLDIFITGDTKSRRFENTPEGVISLVESLEDLAPKLVVFESTGRYHVALHTALRAAGIAAHVANAERAKSFATAKGFKAKTDAEDARMLCAYAAFVEVPKQVPEMPGLEVLSELMQRRRQLKKMLVSEGQRRRWATDVVIGMVDAVVRTLKEQLALVEKLVAAEMKRTASSSKTMEVLLSVPGVGVTTAASLMCWLPELGHLDAKKLTALVGLAPFAQDSGKRSGRRSIRGGRERVRTAMYMSAVVATRFNPVIKTFYQRLLSSGKPKQLAIIACIRKMIAIMNAMVKSGTKWSANGRPSESQPSRATRP